ncbi:MAG: class I SAM-dependent methyltransferase [Microgenomates group bacterium]
MPKITSVEARERHHFDKYAKRYDSNYSYDKPFTRYKILKKVDDFFSSVKSVYKSDNLLMLEVGCGTGEYTKLIASRFPKSKIIGIDISPDILKIAKNKCSKFKNVKFYTKSAYDMKFKNKSFDIVFGFYILHHLDSTKLSTEVHRVLKKKGLLYFYEPNILNPVVFLIKSSKFIKKLVGDSPDEWAINPITIEKSFKGFRKMSILTSEFVFPFSKLGLRFNILLDKITSIFAKLPITRYLGGSVKILLQSR